MNFKLARIKSQLTQRDLRAKLLDEFQIRISPATIVAIEKGDYSSLSYSKMIALAKVLNSTVQELFFSEN